MDALAARAAMGRFYTSLVELPKQADTDAEERRGPRSDPLGQWGAALIGTYDAGKVTTSRPAEAGTGCSAQGDTPRG